MRRQFAMLKKFFVLKDKENLLNFLSPLWGAATLKHPNLRIFVYFMEINLRIFVYFIEINFRIFVYFIEINLRIFNIIRIFALRKYQIVSNFYIKNKEKNI